jgi:hypothetical protein
MAPEPTAVLLCRAVDQFVLDLTEDGSLPALPEITQQHIRSKVERFADRVFELGYNLGRNNELQ